MLKSITKKFNGQGFTLIELLAVMAIVAVLAGIVSMSVSGSGQQSRDTQVQEDANSAGSAVAEFFDDQPVTALLEALKVDIKLEDTTIADIEQEISTKYPEVFVSDVYGDVFIVTKDPTGTLTPDLTVNSIEFFDQKGNGLVATDKDVQTNVTANSDYTEWTIERLGDEIILSSADNDQTLEVDGVTHYFELNTTTLVVKETLGDFLSGAPTSTVGEAHVFAAKDMLTDFTAIDWITLELGGFSTEVPISFDADSQISDTVFYPNYLWTLEKDQVVGSIGKVNSRNVVVFVLTKVIESSTAGKFDLTFVRLS